MKRERSGYRERGGCFNKWMQINFFVKNLFWWGVNK